MKKKAIAYVDGSNLHNQLKTVGLLEKDVDWKRFFSFALPDDYELVRASWYHVNRLAPHQWYPSLTRRYCPADVDESTFETRSRQWYDSESLRLQKLHDEVHSRIAIENDLVDYRYSGVLRVNPYTQERMEEKGVDVGLAVDLVTQAHAYDVAVLVSGDYDFAEAIRFVKQAGKQVHLLTIEPGMPTELRGQAWGLRVLVDLVTPIFESEIKSEESDILRDRSKAVMVERMREPGRDNRHGGSDDDPEPVAHNGHRGDTY
jgi:uncharacterized LabA/DUF88 family protein